MNPSIFTEDAPEQSTKPVTNKKFDATAMSILFRAMLTALIVILFAGVLGIYTPVTSLLAGFIGKTVFTLLAASATRLGMFIMLAVLLSIILGYRLGKPKED